LGVARWVCQDVVEVRDQESEGRGLSANLRPGSGRGTRGGKGAQRRLIVELIKVAAGLPSDDGFSLLATDIFSVNF